MTVTCIRIPLLALALGLVLPASGQDEPKSAPKAKGYPLPGGAKLRLGGTEARFRFAPQVCLLPPDYRTMLFADSQGSARRVDVATGKEIDVLEPGAGGMIVVSADGQRLINVRTGILSVRETATGRAVQDLRPPMEFRTGFFSSASIASLSGDGKFVAQAGMTQNGLGAVLVWDVAKGKTIFEAPLQNQGLPIPILSPDGKFLATRRAQPMFNPPAAGKGDPHAGRTIQVWDVVDGKELFTAVVPGFGTQIQSMAFSPDSSMVAFSCGEGPIEIWDVAAAKPRVTLLGRTRQGMHIAFSADGKSLAGVAVDGTIQQWNAATGKLTSTTEWPVESPLASPHGLGYAADGRVVAWGVIGLYPAVWEAPSGKLLTPLPEHTLTIRSIAFAAGGKELVTAGADARIIRWDAATGKPLGSFALKYSRGASPVGPVPVRAISSISSDGKRALVAGTPASIYDLASGLEVAAIPGGTLMGALTNTLTSPDMTRAVTLMTVYNPKQSGGAVVWDLAAPERIAEVELPGVAGAVPVAALSSSGNRLVAATILPPAAGAPRPTMRLTSWDLKTGQKLSNLEEETAGGSTSIAVMSESRAVIAAAIGQVRIYDLENGKWLDEVEPKGPSLILGPGPIAVSPDGKRFAMGQNPDATGYFGVRVYDWPSGKAVHTFRGHVGVITALAFSDDGKTLASGSVDTTVILWDLTSIEKKMPEVDK